MKTKPRFFKYLLAMLIFGGIIAVMWAADPPLKIHEKKPLPPIALETLAGEPMNLAEWEGAIIVNFFASWCAPCIAELPQIEKLSQFMPVYGIAVMDQKPALKKWMEKHQPAFTDVAFDKNNEIMRQLEIGGLPITLVLTRDKKIAYRHEGAIQDKDIDAFMPPIFDHK